MFVKLSRYLRILQMSSGSTLLFSTRSAEAAILSSETSSYIFSDRLDLIDSDTLNLLKDLKILVGGDADELDEILTDSEKSTSSSSVFEILLLPSSACPLGCNSHEYGGYCGQIHHSSRLSVDAEMQIVERIREGVSSQHKILSITWFGGEPLTGFQTMKRLTGRLVALATELGLDYTADITTGGTLLDLDTALICANELGIRVFNITIDGTKEIHDLRRCTKGGEPTFDKIIGNLSSIIQSSELLDVKINIRCNVDARNSFNVPELIKFIASKNWQDRVVLYFAPVHAWGDKNDPNLIIPTEDFAKMEIAWESLLIENSFSSYILPEHKSLVCRVVSTSRFVVSSNGLVHKCSESPLTPPTAKGDTIGTIAKPNVFAPGSEWPWLETVRSEEVPCASCELLPLCGGACPLEWSRGGIPCPTYKYNIDERIRLFYAEYLNDNQRYARDIILPDYQVRLYSPLALIEEGEAFYGVSSDDVHLLSRYLKSSRNKASLGMHDLGEHQYRAAQKIVGSAILKSPRAYSLLMASLMSTRSYLHYAKGDFDGSLKKLRSAFGHLDRSSSLCKHSDTLLARYQVLANISVVHSRLNHTIALEMLSRIRQSVEKLSPISIDSCMLNPAMEIYDTTKQETLSHMLEHTAKLIRRQGSHNDRILENTLA